MEGGHDLNAPEKQHLEVPSVPPDVHSWYDATGKSLFANHAQTITVPPSVFSWWKDPGNALFVNELDPDLQVVTTPAPTLTKKPIESSPGASGGAGPHGSPTSSPDPPSIPATAHKHPTGAIAGGVVGAILAVVLVLLLWWIRIRRRRNTRLAHHSDVENSPVDATAASTSTRNLIPHPFLAVTASVAPFDISAKQFTDMPESAPIGTGTAPAGPSPSHSRADRSATAREKDPVVLRASRPLLGLSQRPVGAETHEHATHQFVAVAPAPQPPTQTQTQRERDLEEEVQRLREQLVDGSPPAYSAKPDAILPE